MSKKYSIFITLLFCVFIFGFGIALFVLPDKDFSEQENRYLAQFSAPTAQTLKSGRFMEDFEAYVVDQFPLRDWWVRLKARGEKTMGKTENNSVYFGTDEQTLFAHFTHPADLADRVAHVNKLGANLDIPVYFALIPDKSYVCSELLPANAPNVDDGSMLEQAMELCSDRVTFIDLSKYMDRDGAFYRTDHHWTTMGAFYGYQGLGMAMNGTFTVPEGSPVDVSDSFCGTTFSSAGTGWVEPDTIQTWVAEEGFEVTRYPTGTAVAGELYDESFLEKKDKYSMFLGGNQPLCVIKNPASDGGRLLVIRDSYCDSLAPFLAQDYSEVHLIDLRYYRMPLSPYVEQNGIDRTLVLYSNANFAADNNLFIMGIG